MPSISVRRIPQFEDILCGAAVAEMILTFRGLNPVGIGDETWQRNLWDEIQALTTGEDRPTAAHVAAGYEEEFENQQCVFCGGRGWNCWASTPQALAAVLNRHLPAGQRVRVVRSLNQNVAIDALMRSIDASLPAAVLTEAGNHWVVLKGFSENKTQPPPVQVFARKLNGVYIVNPSQTQTQTRSLIAADHFVTNVFGQNDCGVEGDDDRYICIVPDTLPPVPEPGPAPGPPPAEPISGPLIEPSRIVTLAKQHAKELLENDDQPWSDPLLHAEPQMPVLVQEESSRENFYYIVPFVYKNQITSRMAIDGRSGRIREVDWIEDVGDSLPQWRSAADIERSWPGLALQKTLVWRPSAQSRSPFDPFLLLRRGDQRVYVRASDGASFESLTTNGKGR